MKEKMLSLKRWAVLGATDKSDKYGYKIFKILVNNGYDVYPVNPKIKAIGGVKVYPTLLEIPQSIDVVDFVVNPSIGEKLIHQVSQLGIKNIWLQPGARSVEIDRLAEEFDMNVVKDCVLAALT
ncbi:MAG: uncharacterized protein PWQ84_253 [Thermotogaceae bacterium]|jgi:hypothetical protein|nr:uncharacterized protein [Thermotogaceae bacterium]